MKYSEFCLLARQTQAASASGPEVTTQHLTSALLCLCLQAGTPTWQKEGLKEGRSVRAGAGWDSEPGISLSCRLLMVGL